jgi:hypothetical protein
LGQAGEEWEGGVIFRHFPRRNRLREELARNIIAWDCGLSWLSWARRYQQRGGQAGALAEWTKRRERVCSSGIAVMQ